MWKRMKSPVVVKCIAIILLFCRLDSNEAKSVGDVEEVMDMLDFSSQIVSKKLIRHKLNSK